MIRNLFPRLVYAMVLLVCVTTVGIQDVAADERHGKSIVGSWSVVVSTNLGPPPAVNLSTINRDGTMTNSDSQFGTGHGVWKHISGGRIAYKFMTPILMTSELVPPGSMLTVTGTWTIDSGGHTASGPYEAVVRDAFGNLVFPFFGMVELSRVTLGDN